MVYRPRRPSAQHTGPARHRRSYDRSSALLGGVEQMHTPGVGVAVFLRGQKVAVDTVLAVNAAFVFLSIWLTVPACSLRSRTRRAVARGPTALLDLRCARRPWRIRSGRRNDRFPIEQRNRGSHRAQAGMATAGSNGLPVFSTPKQSTRSLRMAATAICLGVRRPASLRRATRAATAGLNCIADSAGM
jgi:hypothetical protein